MCLPVSFTAENKLVQRQIIVRVYLGPLADPGGLSGLQAPKIFLKYILDIEYTFFLQLLKECFSLNMLVWSIICTLVKLMPTPKILL